ncbi:MAG: hypothetical protein HY927_05205 [Elusimicrobia bacterium]|nr:hypothetical protein [Elusimicrobiota bacterium]
MKLLLIIAFAAHAGETSDIKARAEAVVSIDRNWRGDADAAIAKITESFKLIEDRELEPRLLKTYDTRTLETLFEAVSTASEHIPRPELLKTLEDILDECLRRGFLGKLPDRLYKHYVMQRRWRKARELNERFPNTPRTLPDIAEPPDAPSDIPAVYTVSGDGKTLTYRRIDLAGPIIISAVSPGCHFSVEAVKIIEADPKLAKLFDDHAVNIDAASYGIDGEEFARINREGRFRYDVLYRDSGWKGFDFSSTPQFYFVKGGKIAHVVRNVPPAELKERLAEGIGIVGLK